MSDPAASKTTPTFRWRWWQLFSWKRHDWSDPIDLCCYVNGALVSKRTARICRRCDITDAMPGGCR